MCFERICGRLRFIARKATKRPVKQLLQDAIQALPTAPMFVKMSKELIAKINSWSQHQTLARLQVLVEGVHQLSQLKGLRNMLGSISNRQMNPSSRDSLLDIVKKVARYREAARYLCRTARKFVIARRMRLVPVNLPQDAFRGANAEQPGSTLSSQLARLSLTKKQRKSIGQIWSLLGVSELEAGNLVAKQKNKTMSEAKIHAEVQLIFYCENDSPQLLPRVICSSKDACFLCNAFIAVHGKFHTPRSHGRLYPGWRLPYSPQPSDLERRFTQQLEYHIQGSIKTMLSRKKKTLHQHPNESTILTLQISNSTLRSLSGETNPIQSGNSMHATSNTFIASAEEQMPAEPDPRDIDQAEKEVTPMFAESTLLPPGLAVLQQGKTLTVPVEANDKSAVYEAWPLRFQVEYSAQPGLAPEKESKSSIVCNLKWLENAEAVSCAENAKIIDAELLEGCISLRPEDLNDLYICAGGTLLRVCVT